MALASLGHAFPGASPWAPQYTCSIPVLIHMFNLCFSTYVLLKLSKLHFNLHQWHGTHSAQPACQGQAPWTSESSHSSGIKQTKVEILIYLSQFLKLCRYIYFSLLSLPFSHNVYSSTLPLKFNFK